MTIERTHFVYRVFDDRDLLLYVGCTKNLEKRRDQHRYNRAPWLQYAARFRAEGPYPIHVGFARETAVIEAERPFFNALRAQKAASTRRSAMDRRLHRELRLVKPHLYGSAAPMTAEFEAECDRIEAEVNATYPKFDKAWRLATYLEARIGTKAVPA